MGVEDSTRIEQAACIVETRAYACRFCNVRVHRGDSDCGCSTMRPLTSYASLCLPCADALDVLAADTLVGRIHRRLVHEADMAGRPSSD